MPRRPTTRKTPRKTPRKLHGQEAEQGVRSAQSALARIISKADPGSGKRTSKDKGE